MTTARLTRGVRIALLLTLLACGTERDAAPPVTSATPPAPSRPNVVLVVMDTTRGDRCSVNGYARPTTPELERLAGEGTAFTDAWTPAGWTGPAHASLFTGLRPEHHGFLGGIRPYLDEDQVTLAERFSAAGYATALYSNNPFVSSDYGLAQGFEEVSRLYEDESRAYPTAPATHIAALAWARAQGRDGRPFFLVINDMEPHLRYMPPDDIARGFLDDDIDPISIGDAHNLNYPDTVGYILGQVAISDETICVASDLYDAEIATLDAAVGALRDALEAEGRLDDTVFVVTSDHGENLGDHSLLDHKFSLHRSILHVPLVIRYPPVFRPGRDHRVVRLEDVPATLLELAGLPQPAVTDGAPLTGALDGRVARAAFGITDRFMSGMREEFPNADIERFRVWIRSAYDGTHHLISYSDGRLELFDVVADPTESVNLADLEPATVKRMQALLPR